jgi:hypothetical protein
MLSHETETHGSVSYDELYTMMGTSKIVLNFSKTDNAGPAAYALGYREPAVFQFKGRIIEAGLCGACCISEYFPTISIMGFDRAVQTFETSEQMVSIVKKLLSTGEWKANARKLREIVRNNFNANDFLTKLAKLTTSPRKWPERRISIGIDSNYSQNVTNRILKFNYSDPALAEKDLKFFYSFLKNTKYENIAYRTGNNCYPFNI